MASTSPRRLASAVAARHGRHGRPDCLGELALGGQARAGDELALRDVGREGVDDAGVERRFDARGGGAAGAARAGGDATLS